LAAAVLLIPLAGLAWQPFDGFDQPPPAPALATLHVVFDPNYAPLLPAVLAVIGALGLARCDRTTFARLVLPTLLLALFYDRAHDSTSSYLRLAAVPGVLL